MIERFLVEEMHLFWSQNTEEPVVCDWNEGNGGIVVKSNIQRYFSYIVKGQLSSFQF